jgi:hypothetical protein
MSEPTLAQTSRDLRKGGTGLDFFGVVALNDSWRVYQTGDDLYFEFNFNGAFLIAASRTGTFYLNKGGCANMVPEVPIPAQGWTYYVKVDVCSGSMLCRQGVPELTVEAYYEWRAYAGIPASIGNVSLGTELKKDRLGIVYETFRPTLTRFRCPGGRSSTAASDLARSLEGSLERSRVIDRVSPRR